MADSRGDRYRGILRRAGGVSHWLCPAGVGASYTSNTRTAAWKFAAYRPDRAGRHASDFRGEPHTKYEVPQKTLYAFDGLRDCTGACPIYEDNSLKKVLKSRSGEHRTSDSRGRIRRENKKNS